MALKTPYSYISVLFILNEFIGAFQRRFKLTDETMANTFDTSYNNFKDVLLADLIIRLNIRQTKDCLEELTMTYNYIQDAQAKKEQLNQENLSLRNPWPDFDSMEKMIFNKIETIKKSLRSLEGLLKQTDTINKEFSDQFAQLLSSIPKILTQTMEK